MKYNEFKQQIDILYASLLKPQHGIEAQKKTYKENLAQFLKLLAEIEDPEIEHFTAADIKKVLYAATIINPHRRNTPEAEREESLKLQATREFITKVLNSDNIKLDAETFSDMIYLVALGVNPTSISARDDEAIDMISRLSEHIDGSAIQDEKVVHHISYAIQFLIMLYAKQENSGPDALPRLQLLTDVLLNLKVADIFSQELVKGEIKNSKCLLDAATGFPDRLVADHLQERERFLYETMRQLSAAGFHELFSRVMPTLLIPDYAQQAQAKYQLMFELVMNLYSHSDGMPKEDLEKIQFALEKLMQPEYTQFAAKLDKSANRLLNIDEDDDLQEEIAAVNESLKQRIESQGSGTKPTKFGL